MWYRNSIDQSASLEANRVSQKASSEKPTDSSFILKLKRSLDAYQELFIEQAKAVDVIQEWASASTKFKDLYDIFTNYAGEIDNLYNGRGGESLSKNQLTKFKQVYKIMKDFPVLWKQLGNQLTGEFLSGSADKTGYTITPKSGVQSFGNPFGFSDSNNIGIKMNYGKDYFGGKTIVSNNPILQFLEKAGPLLRTINLVGLAAKVFSIVDKINKKEEVPQSDIAEVISNIITIPQVAAIAGPFSPALLAAGFISSTVGIKLADKGGEFAGTTNSNLRDVLNESVNRNKLLITLDDLKSNYGEVYNALVDSEKGLNQAQSISKHIVDNDPYKFLLFNNFRENRERLKSIITTGEEFYPTSTSAYVKSSYYKKRKEQEEKSRYYGPTKPTMQN
jgi:hypothetical protein